jgi:chromosome segregation ATPase
MHLHVRLEGETRLAGPSRSSLGAVTDDDIKGLRQRLQSGSEEALGKLAQDLLENPLVTGAIARAFDAREKAVQAQEVAFNALNLPSAADIERLTRRVRSVSQRLEGIEDGVDRLDERLAAVSGAADLDGRLTGIEEQLGEIAKQLVALQDALPGAEAPVPREQERLKVQ